MRLEPPRTLTELGSDSAILRADQEDRYLRRYGAIETVEFNGPNPDDLTLDAPVQVLLRPSGALIHATRVAELGENWSWRTAAAATRADDPITDTVLEAASTLFQGAPIYLAVRPDGSSFAVAMPLETTLGPRQVEAITQGLAAMAHPEHSRRAVLAAASRWGVNAAETPDGAIALESGVLVEIADGIASEVIVADQPRFNELVADVYYYSQEFREHSHDDYHEALLGTFDDQTWTWENPTVKAFGASHGLLPLVSATRPVAELELLIAAAKPIVGLWHESRDVRPDGRTAVYLSRGPELPDYTPEREAEITARPLPAGLDREAALRGYRRWRTREDLPPAAATLDPDASFVDRNKP